jgi:hypothetical protein
MVGRPMGAPVVAARGEARHRPLRPCGSWVSRRPQALALGRARPPLGQHAVPPAALAAHGLGDAAGPEGAGAAPRAEGGPLARARGRGHPVPPERVLRAPRDLVCLHGVRESPGDDVAAMPADGGGGARVSPPDLGAGDACRPRLAGRRDGPAPRGAAEPPGMPGGL